MRSKSLPSIAQWVAFISFTLGSIIFGAYYSSGDYQFLLVGVVFMLIAIVVNTVLLVCIIQGLMRSKKHRDELSRSGIFILFNVPVAIIYCSIIFTLMNTMRVTFVNETDIDLQNIRIEGCEDYTIDQLKQGDMTEIWIDIPNPCNIEINYDLNGLMRKEMVIPYTSHLSGHKIYHRIGRKDKIGQSF